MPIVPAAVVFDLGAGGDFANRPDAEFGGGPRAAARARPVRQGTVGAGTGAHAAALKGGIGSASVVLDDGITVAALVVLNSGGSPVDPATGELWGARYGLGASSPSCAGRRADLAAFRAEVPAADPEHDARRRRHRRRLTKAECTRLAGAGHDGMARAISPIHTYTDGDVVFTLATGVHECPSADGRLHPPGRGPLHAAGPDHRRRRRRRRPGDRPRHAARHVGRHDAELRDQLPSAFGHAGSRGTAASSARVYGCVGAAKTGSVGPRSTTRPSRSTSTSSHR